jgi:hypothetical protein
MRDLGRHRGKHHCSLLSLAPITFDANTFSCYGGSYFATVAVILVLCRRPLNVVGPSMPTSSLLLMTTIIAYPSEYVPLQNCLLPLSLPPLRALQLSTPIFPSSFFQSYITRAWGMPASFVHNCIFCSPHVSQKIEILVPFLSNGSLQKGPTLAFLYNHTVQETLMDFGYTFAPNLIHQGASVITEISSAHGDKNSTSSKTAMKSFMALN